VGNLPRLLEVLRCLKPKFFEVLLSHDLEDVPSAFVLLRVPPTPLR
jgi:hypothetical protein